MYGPVLGASTTTTSAALLANTGTDRGMQTILSFMLIGGVIITLASIAQLISRK